MNRLPSNLIGHEVFVILNSGEELEGLCIQAGDSYLILRIGTWWEYTVEAEAIAACFTIDQILVAGGKYDGYSRHDCDHWFPASSLELVGPEPDRLEAIERRLDSIEKRLQQMGQAGKA